MTSPVVVTAVFRPAEGARDAVLAALGRAIPEVHLEPGCELYAIHDAPDGSILMIEKWSSNDLLDEHGDSAAVTALRADLAGLLAEPIVVTRLAPVPIGDAGRGAL